MRLIDGVAVSYPCFCKSQAELTQNLALILVESLSFVSSQGNSCCPTLSIIYSENRSFIHNKSLTVLLLQLFILNYSSPVWASAFWKYLQNKKTVSRLLWGAARVWINAELHLIYKAPLICQYNHEPQMITDDTFDHNHYKIEAL